MPTSPGLTEEQRSDLMRRLAISAYKRGNFTLASGRQSEHYVNCKPVSLSGAGLLLISTAMLSHVEDQSVAVAGLTLGADPLVSGVAMAASSAHKDLDALIVRKAAKGHGTGAWLGWWKRAVRHPGLPADYVALQPGPLAQWTRWSQNRWNAPRQHREYSN